MQKLYCYVDETGQDTKGELFLVALVVTDDERDKLTTEAERIEKETGKSLKKWRRAAFSRKIEYIKAIFSSPLFINSLFFASYELTSAYLDLTILATARAILMITIADDYKSAIMVDCLDYTEYMKLVHR